MMLKVLPILCLLVLCHSQDYKEGKEIDVEYLKVLESIFGQKPVGPTAQLEADEKPETKSKREADDKICTTTNIKKGRCVPYYMCDYDTDQTYIRSNFDDTSVCPELIDVCCDPNKINNIVPPSHGKDPAKPMA